MKTLKAVMIMSDETKEMKQQVQTVYNSETDKTETIPAFMPVSQQYDTSNVGAGKDEGLSRLVNNSTQTTKEPVNTGANTVNNTDDINVNNDATIKTNASKNDDIILHLNRKAVTTTVSIIATVFITLFVFSWFTLNETIEYKPDVNNSNNIVTISCKKKLGWLKTSSECKVVDTKQ